MQACQLTATTTNTAVLPSLLLTHPIVAIVVVCHSIGLRLEFGFFVAHSVRHRVRSFSFSLSQDVIPLLFERPPHFICICKRVLWKIQRKQKFNTFSTLMYWKLAVFVASLPTVDQARISRQLANAVIIFLIFFGSGRILVQPKVLGRDFQ